MRKFMSRKYPFLWVRQNGKYGPRGRIDDKDKDDDGGGGGDDDDDDDDDELMANTV
jgi:hypothetical protein